MKMQLEDFFQKMRGKFNKRKEINLSFSGD